MVCEFFFISAYLKFPRFLAKLPKSHVNPQITSPWKSPPSGSIERGMCPWGTFSGVHLSGETGGHLSYRRLTNGIGPGQNAAVLWTVVPQRRWYEEASVELGRKETPQPYRSTLPPFSISCAWPAEWVVRGLSPSVAFNTHTPVHRRTSFSDARNA